VRRKGIEAGRIEQTAPAERKEEDREVSVTLKVVLRHALIIEDCDVMTQSLISIHTELLAFPWVGSGWMS